MNHYRNYQRSLSAPVRHSPVKSRGDTLIEILITFFVIAVGILGASSMQIVALQNVNGASNRDQAIIVAENLAESIRASSADNFTSVVSNLSSTADDLPSGNLSVVMDADDSSIDLLDPPANIQIDETEEGVITITSNGTLTTPDSVSITTIVRWDEDRDGDEGTNCPVVSSNDLDCYEIILLP